MTLAADGVERRRAVRRADVLAYEVEVAYRDEKPRLARELERAGTRAAVLPCRWPPSRGTARPRGRCGPRSRRWSSSRSDVTGRDWSRRAYPPAHPVAVEYVLVPDEREPPVREVEAAVETPDDGLKTAAFPPWPLAGETAPRGAAFSAALSAKTTVRFIRRVNSANSSTIGSTSGRRDGEAARLERDRLAFAELERRRLDERRTSSSSFHSSGERQQAPDATRSARSAPRPRAGCREARAR